MNPLPMVWAAAKRNRFSSILFVALIALAVALGVAISAQERALRQGSARAADKFDLIVAAPGSHNDVLFSVVYLDPTAVELLPKEVSAKVLAEPRAQLAAPIGFGDNHNGAPVVGTTAAFVEHLSGGLAEGRAFSAIDEAVVGALATVTIGSHLEIGHGHGGPSGDADDVAEDHDHAAHEQGEGEDHHHAEGHAEDHPEVEVVGRMKPTGTPWDRAIIVPIEYNWKAHGLGTGHAPGDSHIGAPFDIEHLPGIPAIVVKPERLSAAYGLRDLYRTPQSTAFFPAEVLVGLYEVMGNATRIMGGLTLAAQVLVLAAILAGILAILDLQRQRFAVLRALGAPAGFIFSTVWLYVVMLVGAGIGIGLPLGWLTASLLSTYLAQETGVAMTATIGRTEFLLVGALMVAGVLLATIPASLIYRRPVVDGLRS